MQITSSDYKLEIKKPSRSFECKVTIGNNIYTNDDIVDIILETIQPKEGFSIGNTTSQTLDLTLLNKGDIIYSMNQIKFEIGLKIGSTIEYVLMGYFNIDDVEKTDYTTKFTCYDNMIKFETPYFSSLGDKPTLEQVANELVVKTGVQFTGSLPAYTVSKLEGFTCREILGYIASLCGGNAVITRCGKFTIVYPKDINYSVTTDNYIDYKREEVKYKIGKVSCQVGDKELNKGSLGTDSMEIQFENPWVNASILNDIYIRLNGFSYLGYNMKWQGDLSLDPGDIITVTDTKNVVRKLPILSQKFTYTGGLTSEIGAKGETKNKNSFSSSGSGSNKVDRLVTDLLLVNEALINKANIQDLTAVTIRTQTIEAKTATIENAIIDVAHISDLTAINASISSLIASDATIGTALIGKADITQLNAVSAKINVLEVDTASIKNLLAGNLTSSNIQSLILTSAKVTVENGFIKNAMIESLDVSKVNAGIISTSKFQIKSDDGSMEFVGATQQFKDKNNKVRIQMGKDTQGNFNFIIRGEDGTTTLIDHTGVKEKAIADDLIKGNMIATDAVGEKQINYSSFVTGFNKDTNTNTLKSSKVLLDGTSQTLNIAFNTMDNKVDGVKSTTDSNTTALNVQQGKIDTLISNTTIIKDGVTTQLKDSYNSTVATVNSMNSTIGSHTSQINNATGQITNVDTKVNDVKRDLDGTVATVSAHTTSINGLNSTVSTQGSSISQLLNQISFKVEASDVNTIVNPVKTIADSANAKAVAAQNTANSANTLAGTKAKVFTSTPTTPYSVGYLWTQGTTGDVMKCKVARASGVYTASDWEKASKYTDDTKANEVSTELTIVKKQVATIDINLNGITSRVATVEQTTSTINGNISSLTTRMNTAEQKITDNAIISTVTATINTAKTDAINSANSATDGKLNSYSTTSQMNTAITQSATGIKSEVSNTYLSKNDATANYATKASMTLTENRLRLDFSESGGYNYYFRTAPKAVLSGSSAYIDLEYGDGYDGRCKANRYQGVMVGGGVISFRQTKVIPKNGVFSVSFYAKKIAGAGTPEMILDLCDSVATKVNTNTLTKSWKLFKFENITVNNCSDIFNFIDFMFFGTVATSYTFYISHICINEGSIALPWSPNSNEIHEGSTQIDATGVTIFNGALTVKNKAGATVISADANGNLSIQGKLSTDPNNPILRMFGNCSIDATLNNEVGVGSAIRLKWDESNYIRIATDNTDIYQGGIVRYRFYPTYFDCKPPTIYFADQCKIDTSGGTFRIYTSKSADNGIAIDADGRVRFVVGGVSKHVFNINGTKAGGTIEVDRRTLGMSPIDSPQVLLESVLFNVDVEELGTTVSLDSTFLKTLSTYAVFCSNPGVIIVSKDKTSFTVRGYTGKVDFRIVGYRIGHEGQYYQLVG